MEMQIAQKKVDELITNFGGYWEPLSQFARLAEEVGELGRAINIKYGNKRSKFKGDGKEINEEIADVLFTVIAIANQLKIDINREFEKKLNKDFIKCKGVYS